MRRFATALTVIMAGTTAAAGTAQAQSVGISPAKPCYLTRDTISISGSGFTAGGPVGVTLDGTSLGQLLADPAGNIAGEITLGTMRGVRSHALVATDATNPALTSTASFVGTTLRVTVKPAQAKAGRKLRINGAGFVSRQTGALAGRNVFMHVRGPGGYKSDGRVTRLKAPCGTFSVRRRIVPTSADSGRYRVQFDSARRFSRKTQPRFRGVMTVSTTVVGARVSLFGGLGLAQRWTTLGA
ncbi:MAG TPA: hypothetical protein VNO82_03955 [Solirubrobacteraceae bacterium]|nr:hypothetical protein [Solirubrobacteraceae bacterium]